MNEHSLIIGAAVTALAVLALNWRSIRQWWQSRPERKTDPWADYDKAPARPIAPEAGFHGAPRFTDSSGRPRLPSMAEITSELETLRDPEPVVVPRRAVAPAAVSLPPAAGIPVTALEPTAVYAPPKPGPEPHEWTWWAGRWWPPMALEERLGTSDWLRDLLAAV